MVDSKKPNKITEITRRNIIDSLSMEKYWWAGRLEETEFLSRLFDLKNLPSTDYRYQTASEDIWKHRVANNDWNDDWVYYDERFDLMHGPDERFLRFLCEMLHPVVRTDTEQADQMVKLFNEHLTKDGWEIVEKTRISDRPIFIPRPVLEGVGISVKAAKEVAICLDADYINQQITRMESAVNSDPELAIGTAKEFVETICKTILSERGSKFDSDEKLPRLVKLAISELKLVSPELVGAASAAESIRILLNNLAAIGHHLAELRNPFGTGHGKDAKHKGLESHHARLAVNAATTLGVFLFDCHRNEQNPQIGSSNES